MNRVCLFCDVRFGCVINGVIRKCNHCKDGQCPPRDIEYTTGVCDSCFAKAQRARKERKK
jgi:hypothetical protein